MDLEAARSVVSRFAVRTPLVPAPALGPDVWLKLETDQTTGSFKVRGALAKLASLTPEQRKAGVVAASAGNHGLGVAFAARALGIEARVFVPRDAPLVKVRGMEERGAKVEVTLEAGYDQAEERARTAAANTGEVFISPYDDPWVAAGNGGTLALEVLDQLPEIGSFVFPVGGGGLLAGIAEALRSTGRTADLVGVQSEASPAMTRSLEDGRAHETWDPAATFAEGLEGGVAAASVARARASGVRMALVSEAAIADAMRFAHARLGLRLEGSGAVPIAHQRSHPEASPTVLILTGSNVDDRVWRAVLGGVSDPQALFASPPS
ncbi:MAG: threonine ammonia-lyase [Sandaracinus sp.]|nr:threonine ammonia-lyase [Sandaracinus sp.]|tara:strand:- start:2703 stop:3668 length:966 start_codon:yes stop_codon:yes gene_type:complete